MTDHTMHAAANPAASLDNAGDAVSTIFSRIRTYLAQRAEYSRIVNELSMYDDRGLHDLGIARCEIKRIALEGSRDA